MIKIFYIWDKNFHEFVHEVTTSAEKIDSVIIDHLLDIIQLDFFTSEPFNQLYNYCTRKNIPIKLLSSQGKNTLNLPDNLDIEIFYWETFWFHRTFQVWSFHHEYNVEFKQLDIMDDNVLTSNDIHYPFICLNNRIKVHRCLLMDLMCKHDVLDKGIVSWLEDNNHNFKYDFKYWSPKKLVLDQDNITLQETLPLEYNHSLIQVSSESDEFIHFASEKTTTPLLLNKPFLIAGPVNCHRKLQELGFELYDELFDYSFDDEIDIEKRYEGIVLNIAKYASLTKSDFNKLYKQVLPKLIRNRKLAINYATSAPKEILELFHQTTEKNIDLRWSLNNLNFLNCL